MTDDTKLIGLDLSVTSEQVIEILLEDISGPEIFTDILSANRSRPEILRMLLLSPHIPPDIREEAEKLLSLPVKPGGSSLQREKTTGTDDERRQTLLQKIRHLTVGEKIALALRGGRDIRSILIKDSNKEVVLNVLKNPKVTETEAELIANSRNIPDEALRFISKNKEWVKSYSVLLALVNNPKTPAGIATGMITSLKTKDLVSLERNKNVAEAVRAIAKKMLHARKPH